MKNKAIKTMLVTAVLGTILYSTSNVDAKAVKIHEDNNIKSVEFEEIVQANTDAYNKHMFDKEKQRLANIQKIEDVKKENIRQENVVFDSDNVGIISNINEEELEKTLSAFRHGALVDLVPALIEAEREYKVNVFFLTALIAHESDWGQSNRAINQNNLGGYEVYTPDSEGANFSSRESSVYSIAKLLRNNYLNQNGSNHHGVAVEDINVDYCLYPDGSETDYHWTEDITKIANSFVNYYHNNVKNIEEICC